MKSCLRMISPLKNISSELFNHLKKFGIIQMHLRRYMLKKSQDFHAAFLTIYDLARPQRAEKAP